MTLSAESWSTAVTNILFEDSLNQFAYQDLIAGIPCFDNSVRIPLGSKVVIRADLDVPLDAAKSKVVDSERLATLSRTIEVCRERQLVPVVFGHVGRDKENTAAPLASELERLFSLRCVFVPAWLDDNTGEVPREAINQVARAMPGQIVLLEQTRRYDLERHLWGKGPADPNLTPAVLFDAARSLAKSISNYYVFDALASHNPDWSSVVVPGAMEQNYLGLYTTQEIVGPLLRARDASVVILSGLKIDKLDALEAVVKRGSARLILSAGSVAMALVRAQGRSIGQAEDISAQKQKWFIPQSRIDQAVRILRTATAHGIDIVVPIDFVLENGSVSHEIPPGHSQRDIGPASIQLFSQSILNFLHQRQGPTIIFYNGSMGQFEVPEFSNGTKSIVEFLCSLGESDQRVSIYVGGGDGRLTLVRYGNPAAVTHVFTCGGTVLKVIGDEGLNYLKSLYLYSHIDSLEERFPLTEETERV